MIIKIYELRGFYESERYGIDRLNEIIVSKNEQEAKAKIKKIIGDLDLDRLDVKLEEILEYDTDTEQQKITGREIYTWARCRSGCPGK